MRDPFYWSMSLGRLFGINIRIHWLFPFVALALILRTAWDKDNPTPGLWIDMAMVLGLLFFSVLLHEFGHCFGARSVNGDASEVLLWPLGGLAQVDIPNTPRAHFITAASGPLVDVVICIVSAVILVFIHEPALQPPWNPLEGVWRHSAAGDVYLKTWSGEMITVSTYSAAALIARLFWVNFFIAIVNIVLIGFPLDGGRMFQSILWNYTGYRQATFAAVIAGFVTVFIVAVWGIVMKELLALCLALFIYVSCKQQYFILETGGDESVFGYDFSQGYTSLERDQPTSVAPRPPRQSWWQRWRQAREAKRQQREVETREADESRMDCLLEKISSNGIGSLTEEERRFMKKFSDRYKNRRS